MFEPITVEIDRGYGSGAYRSHPITFTGRKARSIRKGCTTMMLYEWVDRGHLVYLVHVEEDEPGRILRRTLYPFINTHSARTTPTKGYTAEDVSRAYPEFFDREYLGRPRSSTTR
jgi:hypothetical protein